jgi:hypothetical protein
MLIYDDQLLPFTPENLIDVLYLQQVYNLEPQTFGFQTLLRQMGVHNFAKTSNIEYSSTQTLDLEEFQCLDLSLQTKLVTAWQDSFPQHCLTFHHWFEFYKKKYLITPEKCLQLQ